MLCKSDQAIHQENDMGSLPVLIHVFVLHVYIHNCWYNYKVCAVMFLSVLWTHFVVDVVVLGVSLCRGTNELDIWSLMNILNDLHFSCVPVYKFYVTFLQDESTSFTLG